MKIGKYFKIAIVFCILVIILTNMVSAFTIGDLKGSSEDSETIKNIMNIAITIISTIASIISVVVLVTLGIKYMMGSVEEKAQYKKTLLPYVIGASFVFAASSIAGIIYNIAK